jgi:fucose permease
MRKSSLSAITILSFIAFISLGLPDGLLGVAWPSMRNTFSQPIDALGLLLVGSTIGYIFSSFMSGAVMDRLGVGLLLTLSCAATGIALIGFTIVPYWPLIPLCGLVSGLGAGAIDAGLNSYIARHYDERLMQWLHASFGIGVTLGPLIMTAGLNLFLTWRIGYAVVGAAQLALAVCFFATAGIWEKIDTHDPADRKDETAKATLRESLTQTGVWLSLLLFFLYTGVELTLGHWTYTLLTESRGLSSDIAGLLTGSFWLMFTVGRFSAGLYSRRLSSPVMVNMGIMLAGLGALLLWADLGSTATLAAIVILGLAIAPIFPGLVSSTFHRVGKKHTQNTIGMQISAAGLGGAGLPALAGILARRAGIEAIPLFLIALILLLMLLQQFSLHFGRRYQETS